MSLFLSANSISPQEVDEQKMEIAKIQLLAMSSTFNTMMKNCRSKCIPSSYGENELNKGEMTCVDRCVKKFLKANMVIGGVVQSLQMEPGDLHHYDGYLKKQQTDRYI